MVEIDPMLTFITAIPFEDDGIVGGFTGCDDITTANGVADSAISNADGYICIYCIRIFSLT